MRHYAHNIGDYAAATRHLSFVEDAAYRRLLDRYYQTEKPLPAEINSCFRLCGARTKEERRAVTNVLAEFFALEADGYHQTRADREIEGYQAKAQAARENGTKGGRPANREKTKTVSAQVQSEKATTPHSPLPNVTTIPSVSHRAPASEVEPLGNPAHAEDDLAIPKFLKRSGHAQVIGPDWLPSEGAQRDLVKSRPDLTPERIVERTEEFRLWCAETNKTSHNPDATWLGFMRRTHEQRSRNSRSVQHGGESPTADGISAAFARRSVLAGG